jgi:hypothetical protein
MDEIWLSQRARGSLLLDRIPGSAIRATTLGRCKAIDDILFTEGKVARIVQASFRKAECLDAGTVTAIITTGITGVTATSTTTANTGESRRFGNNMRDDGVNQSIERADPQSEPISCREQRVCKAVHEKSLLSLGK